jgi:hypothetical protein
MQKNPKLFFVMAIIGFGMLFQQKNESAEEFRVDFIRIEI